MVRLSRKIKELLTIRQKPCSFGLPGGIRTRDLRIRSPLLYPAELPGDNKLERVMGIEPTRLAWKARALPLSYTRLLTAIDLIKH